MALAVIPLKSCYDSRALGLAVPSFPWTIVMGVQASFGLRIWLMGGAVDDIENGVQALALISTSEHLFLYPHIP